MAEDIEMGSGDKAVPEQARELNERALRPAPCICGLRKETWNVGYAKLFYDMN